MGKRLADEGDSAEQAYLKRQKLSNTTSCPVVTTTDINTAEQLQQLLTFSQESERSINSVRSFKLFLDSLSTTEDNKNGITILGDFLKSQRPALKEENEIFLPELIKIWSFASQSNDERLLSAVPAVFALLLRILSSCLDLLPLGLKLGKTLLLKDQQELIARGLTANKNKAFLISPALRLLRELAIFDAGILSNNIFRARNQIFKGLIRNLNLRFDGDGEENLRRPSVRTNAIRFILQLMKYLPSDSKKDLLGQRDIVSALTRDIKDDPPFLIRDVLETLKIHIVMDDKLPRESKTKILTSTLLARVVSLYRYEKDENYDTKTVRIQTLAHEFLLFTCTSPNLGALLNQTGLYPKGLDPDDTNIVYSNHKHIHVGIESIEWIHKFAEKIPVRNVILADLIKTLRPWSNTKQSELILSIFKAAPELIAEYFLSKKDFSFDPKPTITWIGYAAFIFGAVKLPIPKNFGYHEKYANLPPPIPIVMEHILPQPLSQKVLIKSLSQSANPLIVFSTAKILCAALKKLQSVLQLYQEASCGPFSSVWTESALKVSEKLSQRLPPISHVVTAYRRVDTKDLIQREIFTKLLSLYFEVLPCSAMEINSGAPAAISKALLAIEVISLSSPDGILRALELENLFSFANASPGMKWCSKGKGLPMSPFLAMLRLEALAPPETPLVRLKSVLVSVVEESQLLQTQTALPALDYFIMNLRSTMTDGRLDEFYHFIDECISRCAATPTKYIFKLEELLRPSNESNLPKSTISLLTLAMLEQWPYHVKTAETSTLLKSAFFISRHLAASIKIKENEKVIQTLLQNFISECPQDSEPQKLIRCSLDLVDEIKITENKYFALEKNQDPTIGTQSSSANESTETRLQPDNHNSLTKWINKDLEEVILDGHLESLVMLLSSEDLSIRKEASTNISKLAQKLKGSTVEGKDQIWLLLTEVNETAKPIIDQEPLPTVFSVFCSHAIGVLNNPSHYLFSKVNKFLLQGPVWQLNKIPLFHSIIDQTPCLDGAALSERKWLLNYLYHGLKSQNDLALYRKRSVFEKLLSSYNSYVGQGIQQQILDVIKKAYSIEEGSTTLVTRFGAFTWLEIQEALVTDTGLKNLRDSILKSCDQKRVNLWSRGSIKAK